MKYLTIAAMVMALGLSGCIEADERGKTKSGDFEFKNVCVDGVTYLMRKHGYGGYFSVKFDRNGKVIPC